MLFLQFCCDSNFISEEQTEKEFKDFNDQLSELIGNQQAKFELNQKIKVMDYLKIIRKLYKDKCFRLAKDIAHFDAQKHDGLIHGSYGCLCLRGKCLDRIIEKYFPGVSRRDLVQSLKDVDALKLVAKKIQSKLEENVSVE